MTKADIFLARVNTLLKRHLESHFASGLEKLSFQAGVYYIFHINHDVEKIYYELLGYLEREGADELIPEIKNIYFNSLYDATSIE